MPPNPLLAGLQLPETGVFAAHAHGRRSNTMPVLKRTGQLPANQPSAEQTSKQAKWQFVHDAVFETASFRAVRNEQVRMLPTTERAGSLHVPELPAFAVVTVLEFPEYGKRAKPYPEHAVVTVTDSLRRL